MKIIRFQTTEDFISSCISLIRDMCADKAVVRIALSGGSTPRVLFEALAHNIDIPFERIAFYQVDERYVSPDHPDSNRAMMERTLISAVADRIQGFYFFDTSLPLDECISDYETVLTEHLDQGGFDLVFLGIGTDGHTASLFPHSKALHETERLTAHTTTDMFAVKDRVTITFPVIMKSTEAVILLKGADKREIIDTLEQNEHLSVDEFPAKKLCDHPSLTIFHLE